MALLVAASSANNNSAAEYGLPKRHMQTRLGTTNSGSKEKGSRGACRQPVADFQLDFNRNSKYFYCEVIRGQTKITSQEHEKIPTDSHTQRQSLNCAHQLTVSPIPSCTCVCLTVAQVLSTNKTVQPTSTEYLFTIHMQRYNHTGGADMCEPERNSKCFALLRARSGVLVRQQTAFHGRQHRVAVTGGLFIFMPTGFLSSTPWRCRD